MGGQTHAGEPLLSRTTLVSSLWRQGERKVPNTKATPGLDCLGALKRLIAVCCENVFSSRRIPFMLPAGSCIESPIHPIHERRRRQSPLP